MDAVRLPPAFGREQIGERAAVHAPAKRGEEARVGDGVLRHQGDRFDLQVQRLARELGALPRLARRLVTDAPLPRLRRRLLVDEGNAGDAGREREPGQHPPVAHLNRPTAAMTQ